MPTITRERARSYLLSHLGLDRIHRQRGIEAAADVLERLRCIQIDPLDPMGTTQDMTLLARADGIRRGDWTELYGERGFEHYAKERCLLPGSAFQHYADRLVQTSWWRHRERQAKLDPKLVEDVYLEIRDRGPLTPKQLRDRGQVDPLDWSGWKGTKRRHVLALEVLWATCRIVISGRTSHGKIYDLPSRVWPDFEVDPTRRPFEDWAVESRVGAAGLLAEVSGPTWSTIDHLRKSTLVEDLIARGRILRVRIEDSPRTYLAPPSLVDFNGAPDLDGRVRILGPLDPLIWDRHLVDHLFDFDYVWEVYKPKSKRRWGWYVYPLLHRGRFIGRMEGRVDGSCLRIQTLWRERSRFPDKAFEQAIARHARACGCRDIEIQRRCTFV